MIDMPNYNYWITKSKIRKFKKSLRFALIESDKHGNVLKIDWSEVNWDEEAFDDHDYVTYDPDSEDITWTMKEEVFLTGFVIIDENDGVLFLQTFHMGGSSVHLYTGEQVNVNISNIYFTA